MDEFGVVEGSDEGTALDYLKSVLAERRVSAARRVRLRDTLSRPDLALVCRVPSDSVEFAQVVRQAEAQEKKRDALPAGLLVSCMVLARFTEQITVRGRELTPGDGAAFAWPDLQVALGVSSAWQAVRALFEDDFTVIRLQEQLMTEAGIGVDSSVSVSEADEDPT